MAETVVGSLSNETYERFRRNSETPPPTGPQTVFLFVGGPLDGERRAVDRNPYGDLPLVQGATRSPQSGEWSLWNFACRPPNPHPRFHWYLLAEASGLDGGSPVYVGEDVKKQLALFRAGDKPEATGGK